MSDLIRREDATDVIQKWLAFADDEVGCNCLTDYIDALPTIDADRPKGKWIDTGNDKEHLHPLSARWYRCSVCGLETNAKTNYCFDCGSDMRGEDDAQR